MISITELAKMFNITIRTIRYYEEIGLIEKSERIKGKRYFARDKTIETLKRVMFLKSLGLSLNDVKLGLKSPFHNKLLMTNIRLSKIRNSIKNLNKEANVLKDILDSYDWEEIIIEDEMILEKMKGNYIELYELEEKITDCKEMSLEEIDNFVNAYVMWNKKIGINITFEHICAFMSCLPMDSKEKKLMKIFEKHIYRKDC